MNVKRLFCCLILLLLSAATVSSGSHINDSLFKQEWVSGAGGKLDDSVLVKEAFNGEQPTLGITGGRDRQGKWSTKIEPCEEGERYRFEADFYREDRNDTRAYPEVRIWGQSFSLDTHRIFGKYQKLWVELECPKPAILDEYTFAFINNYPSTSFWMRNPILFKLEAREYTSLTIPKELFFPIGVYGANTKNLSDIKEIGLNTAVITLKEANLQRCLSEDLHCTLAVPREPRKLEQALVKLVPLIRQGRFAFYVNDEPGIHSFPREKADEIQRILKKRFPENFTNMAVVRPWVIPEYQNGADYFMLDQYPVPNMPMTWLSDSIDEAAEHLGGERLQSVIQTFGGDKYAHSGWPRLPTFEEMNHLAFLSVIHGSRGVYFFTYREISADEQGLDSLKEVVRSLNSLRSWLLVHNSPEKVGVVMTSDYKYGPKGKPAVHCTRKEQHNTQMLICANVLRTYVEAEVDVDPSRSNRWEDYFTGEVDYVVDNNLLGRFDPLEVKVWMENK